LLGRIILANPFGRIGKAGVPGGMVWKQGLKGSPFNGLRTRRISHGRWALRQGFKKEGD